MKKKLRIGLLALCMVFFLLPTTALAATVQWVEGYMGEYPLTVNDTVIGFGGQQWHVIGYNYNGETDGIYSTTPNTATLLLKSSGTPFGYTAFRTGQSSAGDGLSQYPGGWYYADNPAGSAAWSTPNEYRGSTLQLRMEEIAAGLSAQERALINARTLTAGDDTSHPISGGDVTDQVLWPLSYNEYTAIDQNDILDFYDTFWLRSPCEFIAAYLDSRGSGLASNVNLSEAVRPACYYNIGDVLFTSDASGANAKIHVSESSVLEESHTPVGPIKLTVPDNNISIDDLNIQSVSGSVITFRYEISGGMFNRLSAIVKTGSTVRYYGNLKDNPGGSGIASVTVPDGLGASDLLEVFAEQVNGDNLTDFVSLDRTPIYFNTQATPAGLTATAETSSRNNGEIMGLDASKIYEYKLAGSSTWQTAGTGLTEISGLEPGTYDVRLAAVASNVTLASPATAVTVGSYTPPASSGGHSSPSRTITVIENSSELFRDSGGAVAATANMVNAFSNSVEVKVTETEENAAGFRLGTEAEVYPFDISLYIKGTNTRTQPAEGYAVTISLPVPENLLDKKEQLSVVHKSESGAVTTLASRLEKKEGVWYLVFEATEFSPYAIIADRTRSYDTAAGLPYYSVSGNKIFIGFAVNGKYIAPDGKSVYETKNPKDFSDVSGHWAAAPIKFVTERELFLGTGSDTFSPENGMTRAMFATVIGRLYERSFGEIKAANSCTFTDCNYSDYYGNYVDWAAENKIINGYGSSKFGPNDQITREQMASILYRFADFLDVLPDDMDRELRYSDAESISPYAKDAAIYSQTTGAISGRGGDVFAPGETATRAEVATIIERFVGSVLK